MGCDPPPITMEKSTLSRVIDGLFNIKKESFYLIIIFLLGLLLRFFAALNVTVNADDMVHALRPINFISAGRLVTWNESSGLWHAFTNILYDLFGMSQITSRGASLIFGSLSIVLIFLLTKEFFTEKHVPLFAAFLLAISPFHIKNTVAEMDVMVMFFVLLAMLFFIKGIKLDKAKFFALSGLFFGLAIYTKVYALLFVPAMILYFGYHHKFKNLFTNSNIKKIALFLFVAFIFAIPALTHNYLLYKDKGFLDMQFTRTLNLGRNVSQQYYSWDPIWDESNSWKGLILGDTKHVSSGRPLLIAAAGFVFFGDPINFILGLLGIIFIISRDRKNKNYLVLFAFSVGIVLPFLASIILLPKHYIFLDVLLVPLAAFMTHKVNARFNGKRVKIIFIVLLIMSLFWLGYSKSGPPHFYAKGGVSQLIEFKNSNIEKDALIIADSRIYRGRINYFSQERPYLEGVDFIQLTNQYDTIPADVVSVNVYYIECFADDCGWGRGKIGEDLNSTMESLTSFFSRGELVKEVYEPLSSTYFPIFNGEKIKTYNIYKSQIQLKEPVLQFANKPKNWFLYDIGYSPKEKQFDYYTAKSFFDRLIDKVAHLILILAVIIAFLSIILAPYLIIKHQSLNLQ